MKRKLKPLSTLKVKPHKLWGLVPDYYQVYAGEHFYLYLITKGYYQIIVLKQHSDRYPNQTFYNAISVQTVERIQEQLYDEKDIVFQKLGGPPSCIKIEVIG